MRHADKALEDDALLLLIQQELAKRCTKSKTRGRKATPAEVVLRMLLLKHVRHWSYETLSREVRANLVYREFTRIGGEKVTFWSVAVSMRRWAGIVSTHCWTDGFRNPVFCIPIPTSASTPSILGKSRMRKRARTDLCGGRPVMVVPTATVRNGERRYLNVALISCTAPFVADHATRKGIVEPDRFQVGLRPRPALLA
jgi:hypothetical protein